MDRRLTATNMTMVSYRLFETVFNVWGVLRAKAFLGSKNGILATVPFQFLHHSLPCFLPFQRTTCFAMLTRFLIEIFKFS